MVKIVIGVFDVILVIGLFFVELLCGSVSVG